MNTILITEFNRDGAKLWFEEYDYDIYQIKSSKNMVLEYSRVIFDELDESAEDYDIELKYTDGTKKKGIVNAFDPSGGPYINVGRVINGYRVDRIFDINGVPGTFFRLTKVK